MKWPIALLIAPLLAAAGRPVADPGYSFEVVQVTLPETEVRGDPAAPFRALSDLAWQRGAREATSGTGLMQAYQGGSPLGRGELRVVYSITPQRGVFYVLPDGPYGTSGGFTGRLPPNARACKMVIKWSALRGGPIVSRMDQLVFPDADCHVPAIDPGTAAPLAPVTTRYETGAAQRLGGVSVSLLKQVGGTGQFNPAGPFDDWLRARNDRLAMMIPLDGLYGEELVYARSKKGRNFVLIEDSSRTGRECLVEGLSWAAITEREGYKGISAIKRKCMDMGYDEDRHQPPLDPHPDIITQEKR